MKKAFYLFVFFALGFFYILNLVGCEGGGSSKHQGKAAPEINAQDWINASPQSLANLKGNIVVVEFWATWCPPCRQSIPHLINLFEQYKNRGVTFISLTNEDMATVKPFTEQMKMTYPVGVKSTSGGDYGVSGIPSAFIIGKDGKILWKGHPMAGLDKELEKAVNP